jgi:hypothetical protein
VYPQCQCTDVYKGVLKLKLACTHCMVTTGSLAPKSSGGGLDPNIVDSAGKDV